MKYTGGFLNKKYGIFQKTGKPLLSIFFTLENCTLSILHCSQHPLGDIAKIFSELTR